MTIENSKNHSEEFNESNDFLSCLLFHNFEITVRFFFSSLLIVSVLFQACSYLITFSAFEVNQNFIVQNLCINKDKPMMNCGGKCYLTKEFKEQDKQQQSPFSNSKDKQESVQFCDKVIPITFFTIRLKSQVTKYKSENNSYSYNPSFFHPPAV